MNKPPSIANGRMTRFFDLVDDGIITEDERDSILAIAHGWMILKLRQQGHNVPATPTAEWIMDWERSYYGQRVVDAQRRFQARQAPLTLVRPVQLALF